MQRTLIVLLVTILCLSNVPTLTAGSWARSAGNSYEVHGRAVAVDLSGNTFVVGEYYGVSIDLGTGPLSNAGGVGTTDMYIAKYDPDGNPLWSRRAGGSSYEFCSSVAVDGFGNSYIAGEFNSLAIVFGSDTLANSAGGAVYDIFIVKYDPSGTPIWTDKINGGGTPDVAHNLVVDAAGNLVMTLHDVTDYVLKYDSTGSYVGAVSVPGITQGSVLDAMGNIYLTGFTKKDTVDFGTGNLIGPGWPDVFVAKYNSNGAIQWAKLMGGIDADSGSSVTVDPAGNVVVAGTFRSPTFSSGWSGGALTISGLDNMFLVKLNSSGTTSWARKAPTGDRNFAKGVATDGGGNIYTTGAASGALDFGSGELPPVGDEDIFVVKHDPNGALMWARRTGTTTEEWSEDLATDSLGNYYLTGWFAGTPLDFGTGPLSATNLDMFVAKISTDIPAISGVLDVPGDQGGAVRLSWEASGIDAPVHQPHLTSYGVWRRIPGSLLEGGYKPTPPPDGLTMAGGDLSGYDFVMSIPAVQSAEYHVVVPTLVDSTSGGIPYASFVITAHTTDIYNFYVSAEDSGYSVDNLAPEAPVAIIAILEPGLDVSLSWDPPGDPDVAYYNVYRSTNSGFIPSGANKVGSPTTSSFHDSTAVNGVPNYYRITVVDVHNNEGPPSGEVEALIGVNAQFEVLPKWNLVAVPLVMDDYGKTALFPTAVSSAFGYADGYYSYSTLENGRGYWLKFGSGETVSQVGLPRTQDTIPVSQGWNIIGALSVQVPVSNVGSIPGGIVTSQFFGYDGTYSPSSSLDPGKGYWVKSAQSGQLVMNGSSPAPSAGRIRMELAGEMPPPPPDGLSGELAAGYSLGQNFPNPFNPVTRIYFSIPQEGNVKLAVFNLLGEMVGVLVDGFTVAGSHAVEWNGSGMPSGVYYYTIHSGTFSDTRKFILMR